MSIFLPFSFGKRSDNTSKAFYYTGSDQTFNYVGGFTYTVYAWGAAGANSSGGAGAYVSGVFAPSTSGSATIIVGQCGNTGSYSSYGGGGIGRNVGGGGGGRSSLMIGTSDIVTVGAGGGAGATGGYGGASYSNGVFTSVGGDASGGDGRGGGATMTSGGAGGSAYYINGDSGQPGSFHQGGLSGNYTGWGGQSGGGGGYYGGGGGGGSALNGPGAGGGGSSYINTNYFSCIAAAQSSSVPTASSFTGVIQALYNSAGYTPAKASAGNTGHGLIIIVQNTPVFKPTYLPGCVLWLDASDINAVSYTGTATPTPGSNYTLYTYTGNGTITFGAGVTVDYLIIAGGGGGGYGSGGGGGAGGVVTGTSLSVSAGTYTITVGAGGTSATNGGNSSFSGYGTTAIGGGAGGSGGGGGANGGSSGGASGANNGFNQNPGTPTSGQGNSGGSTQSPWNNGGGGGGIGSAGQTYWQPTYFGNGGSGLQYTAITGSTSYFAAGGAGSTGTAVNGGGAAGGGAATTYGSGGGGNGAGTAGTGGAGFQGIVFLKVYTPTTVSTWADKSGNGTNFTPYSTYSNATVLNKYQNNLDVLNFSGGGVYQSAASKAVYPLDCYAVVALKDTTTVCDVIAIGATNTDNFNSLTFGENTTSRWQNGSTNGTRLITSPSNEQTTDFLIMNWSLKDSNYVLQRNDVLLTQSSSYTYTLTSGSIFQIGYRQTYTGYAPTPDHPLKGYLAEIIVYNNQLNSLNRRQVEMYLAWKWGIGSPYSTFSPNNIDGLKLWLDAGDTSSVLLSGSNVSQWNDKSGNGFNLIQSGAYALPTFSNNGVYFSNSTLARGITPTAFVTAGQICTTFIVANVSAGNNILFLDGSGDGTNRYGIWTGTNSLFFDSGGVANPRASASFTYSFGTTNIFRTARYLASPLDIYFNGTAQTVTVSGNYYGVGNIVNIGIGQGPTTVGTVYEIIHYNTYLTSNQCQQVEGYLAWKWGLYSNLPSTHPNRYTFPKSLPYSPLVIPGCQLWIDGSDASSITLNGSNVTKWNDKSGNGYNLTGSSTSGITYSSNTLSFTGTSSAYLSNTSNGIPLRTLFMVGSSSNGVVVTGSSAVNGQSQSGSYYITPYFTTGVGALFNIPTFNGSGSSDTNQIFSSNVTSPNTVYITQAIYDPSGQTNTMYINGSNIGSYTYSTSLTAKTPTGLFVGGDWFNNVLTTRTCAVNEILMFNTIITPSQQQQIEGYLAWKWGLQTSLPSSHPYYKASP